MASVISVNESNFQEEVMDADKPVLVDFWAPWCGYCSRLMPIMDELAGEMEQIKVAKVNVDENRSLAQQHNVMSLPTMILFKNGQEAERLVGYSPKANITAKISSHI